MRRVVEKAKPPKKEAAIVSASERDGGLTAEDGLERTGMSHQKYDEWLQENAPKTIGWEHSCDCHEHYCTICSFVIESCQNDAAHKCLQTLRKEIPHSQTGAEILRGELLPQRPSALDQSEVPGLRGDIPAKGESNADVQQEVRLHMDGPPPGKLSGVVQDECGIHPRVQANPSSLESVRICDAASSRHGEEAQESFATKRGSASQERRQERQQAKEFGGALESRARSEKARPVSCDLPKLFGQIHDARPCPSCGGSIAIRPLPSRPCIVLDCFLGSGTTALVALKAGRNFVGIELNPEYVAMANQRIKPLLEQGRLL
jgi:hypothetical protein